MNNWIRWSLVLALSGCARSEMKPIGVVQDCDNGLYFSLRTQTCQALWGHNEALDADGFERIQVYNGITVPRKINGRSPFEVSIAYDLARAATFEVVMKLVTEGNIGGDGLTDWQKPEMPAGSGIQTVVLTPNTSISKGPAAANVDGRWANDTGYVIEIKGGDRYEDEDADHIPSWRVAGVQVDPEVADDPAAKALILAPMQAPATLPSCQQVTIDLPIRRLNFNASFDLALKMPGSAWKAYGGQTLAVEKGFVGTLHFQFVTQSEEGLCAPPGEGAHADAQGAYPPGTYLLQLDVWVDGQKLDKGSSLYTVPEGAKPVRVVGAGLVDGYGYAH